MLFAEAPDFVTQLESAWPTYLVASPIIAAMIASIYLQVQARIASVKREEIDAENSDKAHQAVIIAERAGLAAATAAVDAKNAAATAHSAVARSVRVAEKVTADRVISDKEITDKLDGLTEVARSTHVLVNNEMHLALAAIAELTSRIANSPNATAEDKAAASAADRKLAEHDARQKIVDDRN